MSARAVLGEGLLQAGDGVDLAFAHPARGERVRDGHRLQPGAECVGLGGPFGEGLGAVEREDAARARRRIAFVAEEGFDAGGFVEEGQGAREAGGEEVGQAGSVTGRLLGDSRERRSYFLGFDHTQRLSVHEEEVITRAGRERDFAQRDAAARGEVHGLVILHDPAGRGELCVDLLAGALLRGFRHGKTV